ADLHTIVRRSLSSEFRALAIACLAAHPHHMASSGPFFHLDQASELPAACAFVRQFGRSTDEPRTSGTSADEALHPLVQAVLREIGGNGGVLAVDSDSGQVHVPTSLGSFAARAHMPTLFVANVVRDAGKEATALGLALIARGC